MITKKDIIIFAQRISGRRGGSPNASLVHPVRDWSIGLSVMIVVCAGVSSYAGVLFVSQLNSIDSVPVIEVDIEEYRDTDVENALQTFRRRAEVFEEGYGGPGESAVSPRGAVPGEDENNTGLNPRAE